MAEQSIELALVTLAAQSEINALTDAECDWLVDHIGALDSAVRDELTFTLLARGFGAHSFSADQQRHIAQRITTERGLFVDIDKPRNSHVFLRTFTALAGGVMLEADAAEPFLTATQRETWFDNALLYLARENDWRGFVPGFGWAHGIAHGSDLLAAAVAHPQFAEFPNAKFEALAAVSRVIARQMVPFVDDEEERLANVIVIGLRSALFSQSEVERWLHLAANQLWSNYNSASLPTYYRVSAWKRVVQTLYWLVPGLRATCGAELDRYFTKIGLQN